MFISVLEVRVKNEALMLLCRENIGFIPVACCFPMPLVQLQKVAPAGDGIVIHRPAGRKDGGNQVRCQALVDTNVTKVVWLL